MALESGSSPIFREGLSDTSSFRRGRTPRRSDRPRCPRRAAEPCSSDRTIFGGEPHTCLGAASVSTDDPTTLIRALHDLRALVRDEARDADRLAALSERVTSRLIRHRLFRLWIPRRYDGLELALCDALSIYHAAARIDGSLGWAVMIGAGGGLFAAFLEPESAREIFGPEAAVIAGSGAPDGRAERVPGGYRVRGRWRYASGAPYATTFTANCIVTSGGEPVRDVNGEPLVRAMAFPRSDVEIVETWDAAGMRATASHDFVVEDAFVSEARSFSVLK